MTRLTHTQAILLAHAAQRDSGSLYPLPNGLAHPPTPATRLQHWSVEDAARNTAKEHLAGASD